MTTFSQFLSSLDPDAGKRGKQFEYFIKWFLKNDPEWSTQVDQVWLWDEYPNSWGRDCGIDLVFRHKNGENWAVQAKCYAPTTSITKADVDSFISESNRDGIHKRLLIATTDLIGANAKQVCDAQDKAVTRFLLSNFEDADIEYPATLDDLPKARRKEKPKPRDHQIEAIEAVASNFKDVDRGQLIMACGTGKTFTTLWIKEKVGADSTLVLLPSLGLLSQTLHEWTLAANEEFQVLCVCSDESVGRKASDEAVHSIADLAFPVSSSAGEIRAFLNRSGKKVIFSTYQSSPLIAEAQSDKAVSAFDLAIADEAHRCAGKVSGDFSTILDGEKIRANKRLFTTATPRTYSSSVKKAAEDRGVEVVGMDDEAVFGKQLFALNFGEAIKRGLLTDYRVVIIGVDDPTISAWIENRELLKVDSDIEMDAESLAAQIGLLKAMKDYDLHRLISFHSRVSRAEEFSKDIHKVLGWIDEKYKPSGELKSDFVSGEMPTDKRRRKLSQLKSLKNNQRGLLTNAKCLSEGVDVPSLDGVAFIDPRSSQIDIIQAVGRAIRLSTNKKSGTIVLPVFIGESDDPKQALEEGNFKPIWDVLNALKSHDDVLADELNQIRTELGRKGGDKVDPDAFSKISIDLPLGIDKSFGDELRTILIENVTTNWEQWFGLLLQYGEQHGNYLVSLRHVAPNGEKLGAWVRGQRSRRDELLPPRREKLESLEGWQWKAKEWLPFEEARNYVRGLDLKNAAEWKEYSANQNLPDNIPSSPQKSYQDSGWVSFGDWLGTDAVSVGLRNYPSYEEARAIVRSFDLKTAAEWKQFCRKGLKPLNVPSIPERTYADSGWVGYGDWLGTKAKPRRDKSLWLTFEKAREYVRTLNLKSYEDWLRYTKTDEFPDFLPASPKDFYDESLWLGYRDFLNAPQEKRSFEDAKKLAKQVIKDLNITGMDQWVKLGQSGKLPFNLPTRPERVYSAEWKDWWDWFGKPNTRDKNYLPFNEARAFARSLKLKTLKDWNSYLKQKTRPENIPYHPERAYKDAGWIGWKDWLQKT